ncbi:hypothetical protein GJ496_010073 [Pomphorhynchus laevis]|nr:hypothetical protein GJ496_010073 [Pomphorhynchus laevis]
MATGAKHGTSMRTPMAPFYSNLFLSELETRLINQTETRPWWWGRYIDNVVMIWEHSDESLQEFIKYMNNNSPVKYIYSSNTSMEIPYLDTCITLKDGKWHTKLFIKPNAVVSYIHARSGHSAQTKRNMIRNEAIRCLKICSLPSFFEESLIEIMERFKMRGYRYGEIVRQFNQVRRINRIDLLNVKPRVKEKHIYVPMPYHQALRIVGKDIRFAYHNMDPILRGNTKRP